jgi:hypothetical protein
MDKDGRGSTGLAMGPGRGEDKRSYPRPQAKVEDDVYHWAPQRSTGYEETAIITHSHEDKEEGLTSSNGTAPRVRSGGHCAGRRGKEENHPNSGRVCRDDQQRGYSESSGRT